MSQKKQITKDLSEQEIDRTVIAQTEDDTAWEKPVRVRRAKTGSLSIPADLIARAAFLAQLHRTNSVEDWLTHIIQERIELEEAAFVGAKAELAARPHGVR